MTPGPLVTIVIPCHNQGRFLGDAIRSGRTQTHPRVELIVVDDGSTDHTARIAAGWRDVLLVRQRQRGVSAARNAGLRLATGEYVVFLDADDRLRPDAVRAGLAALASAPEAAFACGRAVGLDADGHELPTGYEPVSGDSYLALLAQNYAWMPGVVLLRRDAVIAAGGFDPTLGGAADYDLYLTLAAEHRPVIHDAVVAGYRQHAASMSRDSLAMWRETRRVLGRHARHVSRVAGGAAAWAAGNRAWRAYYAERLVDDARRAWHTPGRRLRSARLLLAAWWCDRRTLWVHARRKLGLWRGRTRRRAVLSHR